MAAACKRCRACSTSICICSISAFPRVLHLASQPGVEVDRDLDVVKLQVITIQHVRLDPAFDTIKCGLVPTEIAAGHRGEGMSTR